MDKSLLQTPVVAIICFSLLLLLICLNCNSLPPASPIINEQQHFDPRYLFWEPTEANTLLSGNWFRDGELFLKLSGDSVYVDSEASSMWSVDFSGSFYRLTYRLGPQYHVLYFDQISQDSLRFVPADNPVSSQDQINLIPASGNWRILTSNISWLAGSLPSAMPGNWYQRSGVWELAIEQEQVTLNGTVWSLDSVQSHQDKNRLVLGRPDSSIALYYREISPVILQVLLLGTDEPYQDTFDKETNRWVTVKRWYDFLESSGWHDGATFQYDYDFRSYKTELKNKTELNYQYNFNKFHAPRDSIYVERFLNGIMSVSVTGNITEAGAGALTINVAFDITEGGGRSSFARSRDGRWGERSDSLWTAAGSIAESTYLIVMENDTLWVKSSTGKEYLSTRKVDRNSRINPNIFAFPFESQPGDFPDTFGVFCPLVVPSEEAPPPEDILFSAGDPIRLNWTPPDLDLNPGNVHIQGAWYISNGGINASFAEFDANTGLRKINYALGYYDRRWWFSPREHYKDVFIHEYIYTCELKQ